MEKKEVRRTLIKLKKQEGETGKSIYYK